ncbi:hypothetical protein [Arthrobacter castelli]|uniref:hypothetical protein n=1 Tax=Arthrobacter castelli TaxID=271431 RepID=UPI00047E56CB|nr:hypothetical protein [Arthrobacter castelli]
MKPPSTDKRQPKTGAVAPSPPGRKRRPWRLPALFALIALCLVWVYTVDISHAAAIVAGAVVLGLCNEFVEGLTTARLRPAQLKGLEHGANEQQFLAYSLTGDRPVGERAYRRFVRLARGRLAKVGIGLADDDGGSASERRPGTPSPLLRAIITDPERGARMTHAELSNCLDELDALDRPARAGLPQQESRSAL